MDNKLKKITNICKELLRITLKVLHFLLREVIDMALCIPSLIFWVTVIETGNLNCFTEIADAFSGKSATNTILAFFTLWITSIGMRIICTPSLEELRKIYDRFLKY